MAIDWNKPLQTRDGREVRIYARDGEENRPVHGAIRDHAEWWPAKWKADGNFETYKSGWDLVNVPEKICLDFFIVVLNDGSKLCFDSEYGAVRFCQIRGPVDVRASFRVRYDGSDGCSITQTFKLT